jgi:hypothetical protein
MDIEKDHDLQELFHLFILDEEVTEINQSSIFLHQKDMN